MKKILFISNISNKITNFSLPSFYAAKNLGYEFHIAANLMNFKDNAEKYGIKLHHIDLERNPFSLQNITAFNQMLELIKKEKFDVIHCNTPIGGLLGRLCGKIADVPKIIYTAHGFHFYEGSSFINRTLFKCAEMLLARYTDSIITMNNEDFNAAHAFKLRNNGKVYFIHGVGVDTNYFKVENINKNYLRESLGLKNDHIVLISIGDLIQRKNYDSSIKAISKTNNKKIRFLICGEGTELIHLQNLAKKQNVEGQVHFLGYRSDIRELLSISDIFLFTTYQEGLPRSLMEAMSVGLPCIVSKVRGNVDLIENGYGGFLCNPNDISEISEAIKTLANDEELRKSMGFKNLEIIKKFDSENVKKEMNDIYLKVLGKSE